MKQTLLELKNLLNAISVKGDDVLYMAEALVRVTKLIRECESTVNEKGEADGR